MTKKKKEPFRPLTILAVDPGLRKGWGAALVDRDRYVLSARSNTAKEEKQQELF